MHLAALYARTESLLGERASKFLRFVIAGGTAAATNLALFTLFVHVADMYYVYASIAAFVLSILVSFTLQKFWTFRDTPLHDVHTQFMRYTVVLSLSLIVNVGVIYCGVEIFNLWSIVAQGIAVVAVAIFNYFGYKHFVFRERPPHTP